MLFTKELLESLKDSGKDITIYSDKIFKDIQTYHYNHFSNYSNRSYYFWAKTKRPVPLSVVLEIMRDKKLSKISITV